MKELKSERGPMEWLTLVARVIIKSGGFLAAYVCLSVMLALMAIDPLMRYIVGSPLFWSNEVSAFLMVVMFFTALGITLAMGKHVRVTVIFSILPRKAQNVLWVIICLAGLFFASFLGYAVTRLALSSLEVGARTYSSEMLVFPWQMIAVLGLIVFLVALIMFTIHRIAIALGMREEGEEERERGLIDLGF